MCLTHEEGTYPSGTKYLRLYVKDNLIGTAEPVEGGYLAQGRRKPVGTLKEAAKQLLDSKMNACMAEHERWRKLLGKVLLFTSAREQATEQHDTAAPQESGGSDSRPLLAQRWYVLGPPWCDRHTCGTAILAGSEDPHVATFVADTMILSETDDMDEEDGLQAAYEIAKHLVELHNAGLASR